MMSNLEIENGEIDYLSAAFWHQYNIITLLGMLGLGLFIPGLWYLTAGLEFAYLALIPSNKRFQRMIRSEMNRASLDELENRDKRLLASLPQTSRKRYFGLVEICEKIRASVDTLDDSTRLLVEQDLHKLDYLLRSFLTMLAALQRQKEHLATVDRGNINRDIRRLEKEMANARPKVKAVKQRNVEILKQRLARLERVEEDQDLLVANLDTIEATLKLIRDNVVSLKSPEGISDQIDAVVMNMQENERLMESMSSFLDAQSMAMLQPSDEQAVNVLEELPPADATENTGERNNSATRLGSTVDS